MYFDAIIILMNFDDEKIPFKHQTDLETQNRTRQHRDVYMKMDDKNKTRIGYV